MCNLVLTRISLRHKYSLWDKNFYMTPFPEVGIMLQQDSQPQLWGQGRVEVNEVFQTSSQTLAWSDGYSRAKLLDFFDQKYWRLMTCVFFYQTLNYAQNLTAGHQVLRRGWISAGQRVLKECCPLRLKGVPGPNSSVFCVWRLPHINNKQFSVAGRVLQNPAQFWHLSTQR